MTMVTAVSGSLRASSTTTALLEAIIDARAEHVPLESSGIELSPLAVDLPSRSPAARHTHRSRRWPRSTPQIC